MKNGGGAALFLALGYGVSERWTEGASKNHIFCIMARRLSAEKRWTGKARLLLWFCLHNTGTVPPMAYGLCLGIPRTPH